VAHEQDPGTNADRDAAEPATPGGEPTHRAEAMTFGFSGIPGEDHYGDGLPLAATPQEQQDAYVAALRREIIGVDNYLAQLVDDPPNQWHIDRRRAELISEKDSALAELKRLGVKVRT
jgi:hypothetical protein